jgi:hypothetical protein
MKPINKHMGILREERMLLIEEIAERWRCHYSSVLRRLRKHNAKILRFDRNAIRVREEEILKIEEACAETLADTTD